MKDDWPTPPARRPGGKHSQCLPDELLVKTLATVDAMAMGVAVGVMLGLTLFAATAVLLLKGGDQVGPRLQLLGQYFIGYTVTPTGAFVGLLYGLSVGFLLGWLAALLRNLFVAVYVRSVALKSQLTALHDVID